jgi:hypothetical protein
VADQRVEIGVVGRVDRDADAGGDDQLFLAQHERHGQGLEHAPRHMRRILGAADVLDDQRELVAAQARQGVQLRVVARHRIAGAQARTQGLGHVLQQQVAGLMAEFVVDDLEAVEIEEHQRHRLAVALGAGHGLAEAVAEQHAIGQAGQAVVVGQVLQLLLHLVLLGCIAQAHQHMRLARRRVFGQVQRNRPAGAAVARAQLGRAGLE